MPDAETLKLLIGPFGVAVLASVASFLLWRRLNEVQDKRDADNKVLVELVERIAKVQTDDAAAARELAQAIRASGRIAT
jgi:hypothetical protein